eukprot:COSAG04_NODE_2585_length_3892_cov_19.578961_4_plen_281_part_00
MRTAAPPSAASACCATCSSKISPRASRRLRRRPATADSPGASSGGGRARALPSPLLRPSGRGIQRASGARRDRVSSSSAGRARCRASTSSTGRQPGAGVLVPGGSSGRQPRADRPLRVSASLLVFDSGSTASRAPARPSAPCSTCGLRLCPSPSAPTSGVRSCSAGLGTRCFPAWRFWLRSYICHAHRHRHEAQLELRGLFVTGFALSRIIDSLLVFDSGSTASRARQGHRLRALHAGSGSVQAHRLRLPASDRALRASARAAFRRGASGSARTCSPASA